MSYWNEPRTVVRCPNCGRRIGWDGHPYAPCKTRSAVDEPTPGDLDAIEAEWPQIAAEVDLVDAECRLLADPADVFAKRAHRRAMTALLHLLVQQANHDAAITAAPVYMITNLGPAATAEAA